MPIVTNESNKRLNLSISIWRWTSGDGLQVLLGGEYPSFTHVMGQIINLGLEHLTFGRFQLKTMFSESVKNYTHPFQVLLLSFGENYHIIQVDEAIGEIQFAQAIQHKPLESRRGVTQPKEHTLALIKAHTT